MRTKTQSHTKLLTCSRTGGVLFLALLASACADTEIHDSSSANWDKAWQTVFLMNSEAKAADGSSDVKHTTSGPRF